MFYKNVSSSVKTFHGVTFKPGEVKEVNSYINHKFMILQKDQPKNIQQKPSSEKQKKEEMPKVEEQKKEVKPEEVPEPTKSQPDASNKQ